MRQLRSFGDKRELASCVYCGSGAVETRDHVPSRVLLDEPYPENLPAVPSCRDCNAAFSLDEEYFACLLECAACGWVDPANVTRPKISRILDAKPALAARLRQALRKEDGVIHFQVEDSRIRNVVLKLARGHAAFELHSPQTEEPSFVAAMLVPSMSEEQTAAFHRPPFSSVWPEFGSRAMQRMLGARRENDPAWVVVQPGRYRYLTLAAGPRVRFVVNEYLACEVAWHRD